MDDLVRSRRKSTFQTSERLKDIELERKEASNSKKSKAEKKQIEDETSLIEVATEPAERNIAIEERGAAGGEVEVLLTLLELLTRKSLKTLKKILTHLGQLSLQQRGTLLEKILWWLF